MSESGILTNHIRVTKAQLWEEAKGKLRAMVLVEGQCSASAPEHAHHRERRREAESAISEFIRSFEDHGLHE